MILLENPSGPPKNRALGVPHGPVDSEVSLAELKGDLLARNNAWTGREWAPELEMSPSSKQLDGERETPEII